MRAVRSDEHPLPADGVEGRTLFSLVSPGTELNWYYDPEVDPPRGYPVVPGYAAVFLVERVGPRVAGVSPGDTVLAVDGAHRARQRHPDERVVRLPDGLPPSLGAFARMMAVSMASLTTTAARPPDRVGVAGLGLVGQLAARVFAAAGYRVEAWDASEARRALLRSTPVRVLEAPPVPAEAGADPGAPGKLQLVLECTGDERSTLDACRCVRRGGEVALVGVPWRERSALTAHALLERIFLGYVVLRSGWENALPWNAVDHQAGSTRANVAAALDWLAAGRIDTTGLVTTIPVARAPEAYARLRDRSWPSLSALFDWSG